MQNTYGHDSERRGSPGNAWTQPGNGYFNGSASMKQDCPVPEQSASRDDSGQFQNSPSSFASQGPTRDRGKGSLPLWLSLGGAAVVVLVLLWCLVFHFMGSRAYASGEYEKAASLLRKDFLLSRTMLWNAEYQNAILTYNQGRFEQAAEMYSRLGDEAHDGWLMAVTAEAERIQRASSAEAGWEYLKPYAGEEGIDRAISRFQMQIAKEHLEKGQYEEAVSIASQIMYQDEVDLDTFYEKAYFLMGTQALTQQNYTQAADYLLQCKDTSAREYGGILKDIQSGFYYKAAQRIVAMENHALDVYLEESLDWILTESIEENSSQDLDVRLNQGAAKKLLWSDADTLSAEQFSEDDEFLFYEGGDHIGEIRAEPDLIPVTSLSALLQKTAITPAGKFLILREQYGYPKEQPYYAVDFETMSGLPSSLYPVSLSEVEYLITLSYDYSQINRGTLVTSFSDGSKTRQPVVVLRLKGQVRLESLLSKQELYRSPVVHGGSSPSLLGGGTDWKCGDPPRIGKYIYTAITKVMP